MGNSLSEDDVCSVSRLSLVPRQSVFVWGQCGGRKDGLPAPALINADSLGKRLHYAVHSTFLSSWTQFGIVPFYQLFIFSSLLFS